MTRGSALEGRTLKNVIGTGLSRVLGYARDMVLASRVGTGPVMDAWSWAFGLAAVLRRALAESAFEGAALPVLARASSDRESHRRSSGAALLAVAAVAVPAFVLVALFAPALVSLLGPGLAAEADQAARAARALRGLMGFLSGALASAWLATTLRSQGRMAAAAIAPALLNLVVIWAVLADDGGDPLGALLVGSGVGAWAMAGVQAWALRHTGRLPTLARSPVVAEVARRLPPVIGIVAAESALFLANRAFASTAGQAALSHLYYSQRLFQLPLGLIGVGVATAAYPSLAAALEEGDEEEAARALQEGLRLLGVAILPVVALLALHPGPLVAVLFERGAFTAADTEATSVLLALFGLSLPVAGADMLLTRAWYALDRGPGLLAVRLLQSTVGVGVVWAAFSLPILGDPLWGVPIAGLAAAATGVVAMRAGLPEGLRAAAAWPTGLAGPALWALGLVGGGAVATAGMGTWPRIAAALLGAGLWAVLAWRGRWWR